MSDRDPADSGDPVRLAAAVAGGDRRALSRAITLIESAHPGHRERAEVLLRDVGVPGTTSFRLGVSGMPGAGKSTFIEALGLHAIEQGHRLAVLAVDPSSPVGGGSILGDKTRMGDLARQDAAYIRPSPARGSVGGVARRTAECVAVCEAAGFDLIVVESVGVGQSETAVADLTDAFLLLLAPGGGDELQGMKRGIVEMADLIVVNKADGELAADAERMQQEYRSALQLFPPKAIGSESWSPPVLTCSALHRSGIAEVWERIEALRDRVAAGPGIESRRREQARIWLWRDVADLLMEHLRTDTQVQAIARDLEESVAAGRLTPGEAARRIVAKFLRDDHV